MTTNGRPSRLTPLPLAEWDGNAMERMRGQLPAADRYLSDAPGTPPLPGILGLFGHNAELSVQWMAFNAVLLEQSSIDERDRELLILRVAWRTGCAYEWAEHERIAQRTGLTSAQVAAVRGGADDPTWAPREQTLLRAADEMLDEHRVSDETWRLLAAEFDRRQLLELLFVVGAYACLALVVNSAGLAPDRPEAEV